MIAPKDKVEGDVGFLTDKEKEQLLNQLEEVVVRSIRRTR